MTTSEKQQQQKQKKQSKAKQKQSEVKQVLVGAGRRIQRPEEEKAHWGEFWGPEQTRPEQSMHVIIEV